MGASGRGRGWSGRCVLALYQRLCRKRGSSSSSSPSSPPPPWSSPSPSSPLAQARPPGAILAPLLRRASGPGGLISGRLPGRSSSLEAPPDVMRPGIGQGLRSRCAPGSQRLKDFTPHTIFLIFLQDFLNFLNFVDVSRCSWFSAVFAVTIRFPLKSSFRGKRLHPKRIDSDAKSRRFSIFH